MGQGITYSYISAIYCLLCVPERPAYFGCTLKGPLFLKRLAGGISRLINCHPTGESTAAKICIHLSQQSGESEAQRGESSDTAVFINTYCWYIRWINKCLTNSVMSEKHHTCSCTPGVQVYVTCVGAAIYERVVGLSEYVDVFSGPHGSTN